MTSTNITPDAGDALAQQAATLAATANPISLLSALVDAVSDVYVGPDPAATEDDLRAARGRLSGAHQRAELYLYGLGEPGAAGDLDAACAWSDYRRDYGVSADNLTAAHKAFLAGWKAAREGDQSGVLR